ncbi:MAG TPA: transglutaminase family protein [Caulobacteraceae bacterium]|nr:transglutaminase family protein [Caulobacteraceae bacterium]
MLLEVRHVTEYHYAGPVRESVMELWMQPQKSGSQRLVSFEVEIEPQARLFSYADAFGNAVYHFDVPQPHSQLRIEARSAVETSAALDRPAALDLGEWDRLRSSFVQAECFDFLQPYGYATETDDLRAFVQKHDLDALRHRDPLSALIALNKAIYDAFEYEPGVTTAESPIDLALASGRGVCQDFTHIMLAICRSWGLPARYVSGYLFTDRSEGDRSDPEATHAWIEVFLPSLRWVGFDPTNNVITGERHIAVAVGRDYTDVPPSRGVYKGEQDSQLVVGVMVRKARATAAEPEFMRLTKPVFPGAVRRRQATTLLELHREQILQQQQQQQ